VAAPEVAAVKGHRPEARALCRDTAPCPRSARKNPKGVGVEAFLGDGATAAQAGQKRLGRVKIVTLSLSQTKRDGPPASLNDCSQFRVDSTFGTTDRLGGLAAGRVRTVLMQFDVGTIDLLLPSDCASTP
jgi:hypothetical protein